jgi:hypothetical protein
MHKVKTVWSLAQKVLVTNLAAESFIMPPPNLGNGNRTFAGGLLGTGDVIRLEAWGKLTTIAANPGTLTLKVYLPEETPFVAFTSGAMALTAGQAGQPWELRAFLNFQVATNLIYNCFGVFTNWAVGALNTLANTNTAVGINTSQFATIDVSAQFSVANAGNTLEVDMLSVEYLPSP